MRGIGSRRADVARGAQGILGAESSCDIPRERSVGLHNARISSGAADGLAKKERMVAGVR